MKTDKDIIRKNLIHDSSLKKLAICIPTYNRSNLLNRLLKSIPSIDDIMISICDDGSQDNTHQIVKNHQSRLLINYTYQENRGRASALRNSILKSKAEFIMIVDSDDYFEEKGIEIIYEFLLKNSSINFFVFPIKIINNFSTKSASLSGIPQTNYISLRTDYGVKYDLQEVIHSKLLLDILYDDPIDIRRIPTSYLWFKASENSLCLPVNSLPVKTKEYLSDGMTSNLLPLKIRYPKYIVYKYEIALKNKGYKSLLHRFKFLILFYRYSFHNKSLKFTNFRYFPFYVLGYICGLFDLLRLKIFFKK